ncbi:hypothetical protein DWY22_03725 [Heyndrickxia coagulans]|nr:hypothetical protein DWY22_03725 [Heyndrickxia coagulans]RGR96449.1 hypothetical protein DWY16_11935 [Heyndrickxia coagulans]
MMIDLAALGQRKTSVKFKPAGSGEKIQNNRHSPPRNGGHEPPMVASHSLEKSSRHEKYSKTKGDLCKNQSIAGKPQEIGDGRRSGRNRYHFRKSN